MLVESRMTCASRRWPGSWSLGRLRASAHERDAMSGCHRLRADLPAGQQADEPDGGGHLLGHLADGGGAEVVVAERAAHACAGACCKHHA